MTDCLKKEFCPEATTCEEKDNSVCLDYEPPETPVEKKTENSEKPEKQQETQKSIPEVPDSQVLPIKTRPMTREEKQREIRKHVHLKGEKTISYQELLDKDIPKVEYLVDHLIQKSGLVYVFGKQGSFKTNILLLTSLLGADGQNVLGFKVEKPFNTFWIDEENREAGMKMKLYMLSGGCAFDDLESIKKNRVICDRAFVITEPSDIEWLEDQIIEHKPDMVVIDSIAKVFPLDERDEKDVKRIYTILAPLIKVYGVTFVLIHHSRKLEMNQRHARAEDIAGSREFGAMADSILCIEEKNLKDGTKGVFMLSQEKNRYENKFPPISFQVSEVEGRLLVINRGLVSELQKKEKNAEGKASDRAKGDLKEWAEENDWKDFLYSEAKELLVETKKHSTSALADCLRELKKEKMLTKLDKETYRWK